MNTEINDFCLISQEKLETNFVKLECNHKFNYESMFYEILYQKKKKSFRNYKIK